MEKFSSFSSHTWKKLNHLDIKSSYELDSDDAQVLALTNLAKVCMIFGRVVQQGCLLYASLKFFFLCSSKFLDGDYYANIYLYVYIILFNL